MYGYHDTGLRIGFFYVFYISRLFQYFQRVVSGQYREFECLTKKIQIEIMYWVYSKSLGYLQIVAHGFVYTDYKIFFGEHVCYPFMQLGFIGRGVEQDGIRTVSVPSSPSGFLIILFGRTGYIEMYDQTHIGLVYSHTKSICCNHNPGMPFFPLLLSALFIFGIDTRMIILCGYSCTI